MCYYCNSLL